MKDKKDFFEGIRNYVFRNIKKFNNISKLLESARLRYLEEVKKTV